MVMDERLEEGCASEEARADRLEQAIESVRGLQPALEKQLADYRERRREYERLRSEVPSTPSVSSTPANGHRVY